MKRIEQLTGKSCELKVMRENKQVTVDSQQLVPSDIVILDYEEMPDDGITIPCDLVILRGQCIVNESNLTGEVVPCTKSEVDKDSEEHFESRNIAYSKHCVYNGSILLNADSGTRAMVVKTGYQTSKGSMVRQIMYTKSYEISVIKESYIFLLLLLFLTFIAFLFTLPKLIEYKFDELWIIFSCVDLFTIAIPPSLPVLITANTYLSVKRLAVSDIFCISPNKINLAGRINTVVFDKTGTLTEDTLQVQGH